jgi:hypothetical protein
MGGGGGYHGGGRGEYGAGGGSGVVNPRSLTGISGTTYMGGIYENAGNNYSQYVNASDGAWSLGSDYEQPPKHFDVVALGGHQFGIARQHGLVAIRYRGYDDMVDDIYHT